MRLRLLIVVALLLVRTMPAPAQDDFEAQKRQARELVRQGQFEQAAPLLDGLYQSHPQDVTVVELLGLVRLARSMDLATPEQRKEARRQARELLVKAQQLGASDALLESSLASVSPDGGEDPLSKLKPEVSQALRKGEAAFRKGDLEGALQAYQEALLLDPTLYDAALYSGDVYLRMGKGPQASEWFAKAIQLDPDRETAYRYWGDLMLKQGDRAAAREKFVAAMIAQPYDRLARAGLAQWAKLGNLSIGHPRIDVPTSVSDEGHTFVTIDPTLRNEDGSAAWLIYGLTRAVWRSQKFAQTHPGAPYRHSLEEEVEALSGVAEAARDLKKGGKVKRLQDSLASLIKLSEAGLLPAYVLLARADQDIARDYPDYRKAHRDLLMRYLNEVVIGP